MIIYSEWFKKNSPIAQMGYRAWISGSPDWLKVARIIRDTSLHKNSKFLSSQAGYQLLKLDSQTQFLVASGNRDTAKSHTDLLTCTKVTFIQPMANC